MIDLVGNSVWQLITQSDMVSKVVLVLLLGMSVLCWTVFLCKIILVRLRMKDVRNGIAMVERSGNAQEMVNAAALLKGTVPGNLLTHLLVVLNSILEVKPPHASDILQYHIDQSVDAQIAQEESYLPILSTCAAVAPLLGLFGTVWGLVHAFISISHKQSADITVVAPGIAEALMTTLAGLVVAIPALIMYNVLAVYVRKLESQIVLFADKLSFLMQPMVGHQ